MSKFEISKFRYLWQDLDGAVLASTRKPHVNSQEEPTEWIGGGVYHVIAIGNGVENPDWQNTLIDLEADDYTLENGILRRV